MAESVLNLSLIRVSKNLTVLAIFLSSTENYDCAMHQTQAVRFPRGIDRFSKVI